MQGLSNDNIKATFRVLGAIAVVIVIASVAVGWYFGTMG